MSWGAMGGLGQAFTDMANNMAEMDKAKLRDKLETDREMARESRAEARTKRTVADRRLENVGGKYMWREVNSYGEPIREVEASPEEVKKIQNEAKISDLTVRKGNAEATVAEVTAADAPASIERKIAEHKSGLAKDAESIRASKDASARGWKGLELEGERNRISEKGLAAKLSGADAGDGQAESVEEAVKQARKAGLPEAIIQRLRRQAASKTTPKDLPKGGTVNIKPTPEQANSEFIELLNKELQKSYKAGNKGLIRGQPGALETQ